MLKIICARNGEEAAHQDLRTEGFIGGTSRGLQGVDWVQWKHRFHVDKMEMAGHSFKAATVVEVLRNTERFNNVLASIIYDIWRLGNFSNTTNHSANQFLEHLPNLLQMILNTGYAFHCLHLVVKPSCTGRKTGMLSCH